MTEANHDVVIVDDDHCEAPVLSAPPMHATAMQDGHAHGSKNMVLDDTESDEECDFQGALKLKTTPGKKGAGGKKTTPGNKGAGRKKLTSDPKEKRSSPDDDSDGDFKVPTKKSRKTCAKGKGQMGIGSFFSKESAPSEKPADHRGWSSHVALERHMHPSEGGITLSEGGSIPHFIASQLKAHQVDGIQFMWKHIGSHAKPGGCILAHSMGLGKSLQVCATIHAFCKRQMAIKKAGTDSAATARRLFLRHRHHSAAPCPEGRPPANL